MVAREEVVRHRGLCASTHVEVAVTPGLPMMAGACSNVRVDSTDDMGHPSRLLKKGRGRILEQRLREQRRERTPAPLPNATRATPFPSDVPADSAHPQPSNRTQWAARGRCQKTRCPLPNPGPPTEHSPKVNRQKEASRPKKKATTATPPPCVHEATIPRLTQATEVCHQSESRDNRRYAGRGATSTNVKKRFRQPAQGEEMVLLRQGEVASQVAPGQLGTSAKRMGGQQTTASKKRKSPSTELCFLHALHLDPSSSCPPCLVLFDPPTQR